MAHVWVKAKSIVRLEKNGRVETYHPGDWCSMGRQQARELLARDQVEILKPAVLQSVQDLSDCAILLSRELEEVRLSLLMAQFPGVPIQIYSGDYPDEYGRFLLWDTLAELRHELFLTGFKLLEKWQIAVPLRDYHILAESIGTDKERSDTKNVIHDLRVPVYDCRVLFVRQCQETKKLFELWQDNGPLGFLRALYQSRPLVNALPPSWILK
jgi:hypothetical protein